MKIEIVNGLLCFTGDRSEPEQKFLNSIHRCSDDNDGEKIVKMRTEATTDGVNVIAVSLAPIRYQTE